jgi:hypothetical protein
LSEAAAAFEFAESVPDHDKYDLAIMLAGASIRTMVVGFPSSKESVFPDRR